MSIVDNIARMGLDIIKHRGMSKQKPPSQAVSGEAGPEVDQPAYYADGGVTPGYLLDPGEWNDADDEETEVQKAIAKARQLVPGMSPEGEANIRAQVQQYRKERGLGSAAMPAPVEGQPGSRPTDPVMPGGPADVPQEPVSQNPAVQEPQPKQPEPGTGMNRPQSVSGGRNPKEWRFDLPTSSWIPRNAPAGAGGPSPYQGGPIDIAALWDYLDPEQLFPGVSKEWAREMYRWGPGFGDSQLGDPAVGAAADNRLQTARAGYSEAAKPVSGPAAGGGQPRSTSSVYTGSDPGGPARPASNRVPDTAAAAGQPAAGAGQPANGQPSPDEEFIIFQGQKLPLSEARRLVGDLDAGVNLTRDELQSRANRIASGQLTPTTLNRATLNLKMSLPPPDSWGKPQVSPLTGAQFMFKPTEVEDSVTGKRLVSGATFDLYLSDGQGGFAKVQDGMDIDMTKQVFSQLQGGANAAMETNPEWAYQQKSDLRSRLESDPNMAAALRSAVTEYDSPDAQNARGMKAYEYLVNKDPAERQKLASELQRTGQLPFKPEELDLPKSAVIETNDNGQEQFVKGLRITRRLDGGQDGSPITRAIIQLPDGRYYEYVKGRDTLRLTDESGSRVGGPEPVADSGSGGEPTTASLPKGHVQIGDGLTAKPTDKTEAGVAVFEGSDGRFYWQNAEGTWYVYPEGEQPAYDQDVQQVRQPARGQAQARPVRDQAQPTSTPAPASVPATAVLNGVTLQRRGNSSVYLDPRTGKEYMFVGGKWIEVNTRSGPVSGRN